MFPAPINVLHMKFFTQLVRNRARTATCVSTGVSLITSRFPPGGGAIPRHRFFFLESGRPVVVYSLTRVGRELSASHEFDSDVRRLNETQLKGGRAI